jgi:histidinol-phosphatase (PHP family)
VIGVAEHAPRLNHRIPFRSLYFSEFDRYFDTLEEIKMEFAGYVEVLIGLEVDYHPAMVEPYREILPRLPLDFVAGAIHSVDDWVIDLPGSINESSLAGKNILEVYQGYFSALMDGAKTGLFDFITHPDFVRKAFPDSGISKVPELQAIYAQTAEVLSACGVGIEINSRGLIIPEVGDYYPEWGLLVECARAGVPLTFASDSHDGGRVGDGFDQAMIYAIKAGFKEINIWRQRQRLPILI